MEARLILSLVGLCLSLAAAMAVFLASRRPGGRKPFLSLVLLEAALYFLSELISASMGRTAVGLALNFGSALYSMPSLYFFAREALGEDDRPLLRHYLPALANIPLGTGLALLCASRGFRAGLGTAAYMVAVELGQTVQLVAYGRAGLALTRSERSQGRGEWPRRIMVVAMAGYGSFLALSWAGFGFTLASELLDRPIMTPAGLGTSSIVSVFLFVWTLGLCALWGKDLAEARKNPSPKYGGRPLAEEDSAGLLKCLRSLLAVETDLGARSVEPRRLASRLGVPYYLLSRAVNEGEGMTISELVNEFRVERAKRLLEDEPGLGILEVALESGFQAKSTFNEVFRRLVGMSPSQYRSSLPKR